MGRQNGQKQILTLALDRILKLDFNLNLQYDQEGFDGETYYRNTIGVTVLNGNLLTETLLKIDRSNAPYVLTKPFHSSQKLVDQLDDGSIVISLLVHHNFEFERLILGFGDSLEVLEPKQLRRRMKRKLKKAFKNYESSLENE